MAGETQSLLVGAALAIPFTLLLTLVFLLFSRRNRRRRTQTTLAAKTRERDIPSIAGGEARQEAPARDEPREKQILAAFTSEVEVVRRSIAEAEANANADKVSLAPLYLRLAAAEGAAGNLNAQLSALRSAAGLGALHGPRSAHAEARMALADIAARGGDLTSACEHWQLARISYHDDGDAKLTARVEKLMRDNGCPTDWVLTDF